MLILLSRYDSFDLQAIRYSLIIMPLIVGVLVLYYYWRHRQRLASSSIKVEEVKKILQPYFAYYNVLPTDSKTRFEQRVIHFIEEKRFIGRGFKKVTLEMKILIAASAVQLTFGLPEISLQHFDKILIYPEQYYSLITRNYHKGEVNQGVGAIVISWQSFVEGYAKPHDSFNLGLHEMAHALKLENLIDNDEHGFLPEHLLEQWHQQATPVMQKIRAGTSDFFRSYAGTNEDEFFAVAVENFFERPLEFYQQFSALYSILVLLLNQDPLKMTRLGNK